METAQSVDAGPVKKAITVPAGSPIKTGFVSPGDTYPLVLSPTAPGVDLATWAADFDSAQRECGPGPSNFPAQTDAEAFVERGSALAARLQTELGDAWHVEYTPTPSAFPAR